MHNTSEIIDCGTHIRTAPFARAIYDTAATQVVINSWNNVYANQASAAEIGIYVDGVYQESVRATADGTSTHTVALPAGMKRVEIVTNGYRGPAVVNIPSLIGPSIWLKSLNFNAPATKVPPSTQRGVVIIGDSIANGSKLASAVREAYPRLLQADVDFPINVVGRGGLALHDITTTLGTQTNFRPTKLVREVIAYNPQLVIFALGYNDAARNVWNAETYAAAIDTLASEIAAHLPDVEMGAMTLLHAINKQGNYATIQNAALNCTTAAGFVAPTLLDTDLDEDGVHPNASGHEKIAAVLAPFVNARAMPTATPSTVTELPAEATSTYAFYTNGEVKYWTAAAYRPSPRWYVRGGASPGSSYQIFFTTEAGSPASVPTTWATLSAQRSFNAGTGDFRVRADIRKLGTTEVIATHHIWRGAGMAPTP